MSRPPTAAATPPPVVSGVALGGTGSTSVVVQGRRATLVTQTVSGTGALMSINPPGGLVGSRLTWIERTLTGTAQDFHHDQKLFAPIADETRARPASRAVSLSWELMITLAIAAILRLDRHPCVQQLHTEVAPHGSEKTALLDMASMEKRFFSKPRNSYSQLTTDLGYRANWPVVVGNGYYEIQMPAVNPADRPVGR